MRWIGDNTYGVYLWHIPITVLALTVLDAGAHTRAPAGSGWWLLGFLVVVSGVARLSYRWIELPSRLWLRKLEGTRSRA